MKQRLTYLLLGSALMFALNGCEVLYDIGQETAAQDCERIVEATRRNDCVKRARAGGYTDYEKQREQLKNPK